MKVTHAAFETRNSLSVTLGHGDPDRKENGEIFIAIVKLLRIKCIEGNNLNIKIYLN